MINTNSFRIGNFISQNGIICEVKAIKDDLLLIVHPESHTESQVIGAKIETLDNVLFTEQILDNFGFATLQANSWQVLEFQNIELIAEKNIVDNIIYISCVCKGNYFANNLKYVHELQNLYFILRGYEIAYSHPKRFLK